MKKSVPQIIIIHAIYYLFASFFLVSSNLLPAQTGLEVEGQIFSKKSTTGYNILMTNTDDTKQSDLTMYSSGSSFSLYHYGHQQLRSRVEKLENALEKLMHEK